MVKSDFLSIEPYKLAQEMSGDPEGTLDTLADMAAGFGTAAEAEDYIGRVATMYTGELRHRAVTPFLRMLADALEAREASY